MKIGISICEKKEKYDRGQDGLPSDIKLYMEWKRKFEKEDQKNVPLQKWR